MKKILFLGILLPYVSFGQQFIAGKAAPGLPPPQLLSTSGFSDGIRTVNGDLRFFFPVNKTLPTV